MPEYLKAAFQEKISTFYQLPTEPFWQAWQRFDGYQRECPHHEYINDELLAFFYNGVTSYYQYKLDAAGFWDFCAEENFQGAYRLINNMAFGSRNNPMAKLDSQTYCLMEEANIREESIYFDLEHQKQAPPPQYQNTTPEPSKSMTNLEDLQAVFYKGFLEAEKAMKKLQEEFVAMRGYSESKLIASDTPMRMVGNQVNEDLEFNTAESKDATLDQLLSQQPFHDQFEDAHNDKQTSALSPPPEPVRTHEVSYPTFKKSQEDLEEAKCEEVMTISAEKSSIVDAIQSPPMVDEKVIRKCGATLQNQLATRFGNSTCSELSVKFEDTTFANSYYVSGSSLNWMTYATAQSLGFTFNHFKDTNLSLEFADQSKILALGVLKDLVITIDNIPMRVDFAVIALGKEFDDTIILGEDFEWVTRFILGAQEEKTDLHLGDNTTTSQDETEKIDSELETVGAESAEEINLPPLPERFCTPNSDLGVAERVDTLEEELEAAESKEVMLDFAEEPLPVDAGPKIPVEQEEMSTLDEDTHQNQEVKEHRTADGLKLHMETNDISTAATYLELISSFSTADQTTKDTIENAAIMSSGTLHNPCHEYLSLSSRENETRHEFCAGDIIENVAMPRSGPDKPEHHMVSQFDRIAHHDIEDRIAHSWSMSKKGNGFPWDDGISRELEVSDDPWLDSRNLWGSHLLKLPLLFGHKLRGFLIKDGGKSAGIPRTGPDIPSFHKFDQSQFLSFAGEGSRITYCDVIGSVTRPPEVLLDVPVLC